MSTSALVAGDYLGAFVDWDMEQSEDPVTHAPTMQLVFTWEIDPDVAVFGGRRVPHYMTTATEAARNYVLGVVEVVTGIKYPSFGAFIADADRSLTPQVARNKVLLVFKDERMPNGVTRTQLKYVNRPSYGFKNSIRGDKRKRQEFLLALQAQEGGGAPPATTAQGSNSTGGGMSGASEPPTTFQEPPREQPAKRGKGAQSKGGDPIPSDDIPF